ncbi:hypothetical protein D6777_01550 [Candidatus Woesearchaeota archaeon]|nr:MAG: hypothetical protein D6777_01550 [Candidatus Woesearchaeota archaeon]
MDYSKLFLLKKEVGTYFFETYKTLANVMGADDSIDEKGWFIYSGYDACIAYLAFKDPDFVDDLKDEKKAKRIVNSIIMESYHYRLKMEPLAPEYVDKAKSYLDDIVNNGFKPKKARIYFNSKIVLFPKFKSVHKEEVAHEAGHALYDMQGKSLDEMTRRFDHELFATFSSDYMLRKDGFKLSDIIDVDKQDDLAKILWKVYSMAERQFDDFLGFVNHVREFFHGRKSFEDCFNQKTFN